MDEHMEQDFERKPGVKKHNSKKRFEKNQHACCVEGFSTSAVSSFHCPDSTGRPYSGHSGHSI